MKCKDCLFEIEEAEPGSVLSFRSRAHLDKCFVCRNAYHERHSLSELFEELETVRAPADFYFRLAARLAVARSAAPRRRTLWNFAPGTTGMALAASFVIVIIAAVSIKTRIPSFTEIAPTQTASNNDARPPAAAIASDSAPTATLNSPASVSQNQDSIAHAQSSPTASDSASAPRYARTNGLRRSNSAADAPETRGATSEPREDYSVQPAPLITEASLASNQIVDVPVRASSRPLRINVRDERGTTRAVSLDSVSFGSQDMSGALRPQRASLSSGQGIW